MDSSLYSVDRSTEYTAVKTQTSVTTVLFIEVNHRMKFLGFGRGREGGGREDRGESAKLILLSIQALAKLVLIETRSTKIISFISPQHLRVSSGVLTC